MLILDPAFNDDFLVFSVYGDDLEPRSKRISYENRAQKYNGLGFIDSGNATDQALFKIVQVCVSLSFCKVGGRIATNLFKKQRYWIMSKTMVLIFRCLLCLIVLPVSLSAAGETVSHEIYARLLAAHVIDGSVDYKGFAKDRTELKTYLNLLSRVDPNTLSENEAKAFYINLYNASTIELILTRYPDLSSIKDLGTFFQISMEKGHCQTQRKNRNIGLYRT